MEYIIVIEPKYKNPCILQNDSGFVKTYCNYNSANIEAEKWKESGCCKSYNIYGLCNDDKNYII